MLLEQKIWSSNQFDFLSSKVKHLVVIPLLNKIILKDKLELLHTVNENLFRKNLAIIWDNL